MEQLTQEQRTVLLDRAVEAMRAWLTVGSDTDPVQVDRLRQVASMSVTDAVTRGGYLHTQITHLVGCSGLRLIELIADPSAQAHALSVEHNAAKNYLALVEEKRREHAVRRVGANGGRGKTRVGEELGVSRQAVTNWWNDAVAASQQIP